MDKLAKHAKNWMDKSKNFDFDLNYLKGPSINVLLIADFGMSKVPKK